MDQVRPPAATACARHPRRHPLFPPSPFAQSPPMLSSVQAQRPLPRAAGARLYQAVSGMSAAGWLGAGGELEGSLARAAALLCALRGAASLPQYLQMLAPGGGGGGPCTRVWTAGTIAYRFGAGRVARGGGEGLCATAAARAAGWAPAAFPPSMPCRHASLAAHLPTPALPALPACLPPSGATPAACRPPPPSASTASGCGGRPAATALLPSSPAGPRPSARIPPIACSPASRKGACPSANLPVVAAYASPPIPSTTTHHHPCRPLSTRGTTL